MAAWFSLTGAAHAYTRAFLVNNTGQKAYSLHVRLTEPAQAHSAGTGILGPQFVNALVSADGMTLEFTVPTNPLGILPDAVVWLGWTDADALFPGKIASYYWGDAEGDAIGGIQYPTAGDTGTLSSNLGAGSGGNGGNGGDGPSGGNPTGNTTDPTTGKTPHDTGDPPVTGGGTTATPEAGTSALLFSGLMLFCVALPRFRRSRS